MATHVANPWFFSEGESSTCWERSFYARLGPGLRRIDHRSKAPARNAFQAGRRGKPAMTARSFTTRRPRVLDRDRRRAHGTKTRSAYLRVRRRGLGQRRVTLQRAPVAFVVFHDDASIKKQEREKPRVGSALSGQLGGGDAREARLGDKASVSELELVRCLCLPVLWLW